jgi:hypothetical protein
LPHPLEDRQDERRRLAGAGAGLTEHIDTRQCPWDQPRLDGRGHGVACALDRGERLGGEAEGTETAARLAADGLGTGRLER